MRRLILTCALAALLTVACGTSTPTDEAGEAEPTTAVEDSATTQGDSADTTEAPGDATTSVCAAYNRVAALAETFETVVTGGEARQQAAQAVWDAGIAEIFAATEGEPAVLANALDVLGELKFAVSESAVGPTADELDAATATLDEIVGADCGAEDDGDGSEPAPECPAPEVLAENNVTCDSNGNLNPIEGGQVEECPAPEVLEAEGVTCDSEGNLTPISGGKVEECPAPEVLEAEGYTCDSEGNLEPIE